MWRREAFRGSLGGSSERLWQLGGCIGPQIMSLEQRPIGEKSSTCATGARIRMLRSRATSPSQCGEVTSQLSRDSARSVVPLIPIIGGRAEDEILDDGNVTESVSRVRDPDGRQPLHRRRSPTRADSKGSVDRRSPPVRLPRAIPTRSIANRQRSHPLNKSAPDHKASKDSPKARSTPPHRHSAAAAPRSSAYRRCARNRPSAAPR